MTAGIYRHYKGGLYQCLGLAAHSETDDYLVVYVSLTGAHLPGPRFRVRPLAQWVQKIEWPDGIERARYTYLGDELPQ
jgi:hypothetical protein